MRKNLLGYACALAFAALGLTAAPAMATTYGSQAACSSCSTGEVGYQNLNCHQKNQTTLNGWVFFYTGDFNPACATQGNEVNQVLQLCEQIFPGTNCVKTADFHSANKTCQLEPEFSNYRWLGWYTNLYIECGNF